MLYGSSPGWPANRLWNHVPCTVELPAAVASGVAMRGCSMPWPCTTVTAPPGNVATRGRFSGCAAMATSSRSAPGGRAVSLSSVTMWRMPGAGVDSAPRSMKRSGSVCGAWPASSVTSASVLPRLRSQPIHFCSVSLQRRSRCSSRKRGSPPQLGPWRWFSASTPARAWASSAASCGICWDFASPKSLSSANCASLSRLARWWRSSCASSVAMPLGRVSMQGITTSTRASGGMPPGQASRGSRSGREPSLMRRLASATMASLAGSAASSAAATVMGQPASWGSPSASSRAMAATLSRPRLDR